MADEAPQPPSTTEQTTPSAPAEAPPSPAPPVTSADVEEPPLASVELEKDNGITTQPLPASAAAEAASEVATEKQLAAEVHQAVTVVEKQSPLTPATSDAAVAMAVEQVSVTVPEVETKRASQPLLAALAVPKETEPPPETTIEKEVIVEAEKPKPIEEEEAVKKVPEQMPSFKEESNKISDLSDSERKSLEELNTLIQEAIKTKTFAEETSIWGIPLMKDERAGVVLLKFLRARDFRAKESFAMLKSTITWRNKYKVDDELINEELGDDIDKVVFMHGHDKEGHPVCYNVYGEFQNKELYSKTFGDEENRARFLRWRIQFLERSIRKLDFRPAGVNTIFQVSDLKNSPGPAKRELRIATKQALQLLQDNYPEFVAKQVFINVPWWYLAFYTIISPFMTQRTKSKFVFAGPSKTAETLFKYISPEQVPIQYGGLSVDFCQCNPEFTIDDPATEIIVKPATKQMVEIVIHEKCILVWELRVVGWEVSYSAEYVPNVEGAYTVMIQKTRKMTPTDEPVVSNSFKVAELGKILLTVNNPTSKKKRLLYRYKVKAHTD